MRPGDQLLSSESKKRSHNLTHEDEEEPMVIRRNRCTAERRFRAERQRGARRVRDERQEVMTVSTTKMQTLRSPLYFSKTVKTQLASNAREVDCSVLASQQKRRTEAHLAAEGAHGFFVYYFRCSF